MRWFQLSFCTLTLVNCVFLYSGIVFFLLYTCAYWQRFGEGSHLDVMVRGAHIVSSDSKLNNYLCATQFDQYMGLYIKISSLGYTCKCHIFKFMYLAVLSAADEKTLLMLSGNCCLLMVILCGWYIFVLLRTSQKPVDFLLITKKNFPRLHSFLLVIVTACMDPRAHG